MRLVDANVLLYAIGSSPEDAGKRRRARALLAEPDIAVSAPSLQEFYHQATRPNRPGRLTHDDALRFLEPLLRLPTQALTVEVFQAAVSIRARFRLSCCDSAILAAARAMGCDAVYSEDMSSKAGLRRPARDRPVHPPERRIARLRRPAAGTRTLPTRTPSANSSPSMRRAGEHDATTHAGRYRNPRNRAKPETGSRSVTSPFSGAAASAKPSAMPQTTRSPSGTSRTRRIMRW